MQNYFVSKKSTYVVAEVLAMALHSSAVLADELLTPQQEGDITYVTGGIGDEERTAMRAVQHDYNMHVLSAAGASGEYPGDTHICILDTHSHKLVDTDTDPLFYAKLPAGHYVVEESSAGQSKKQSIVMGSNKPVNITFRWK